MLASNLRLAFRSLLRTPVRSFLVLQGIAWGVGIAIFPAAVLEGSRAAAVRRAEETGTGRISLLAEPGSRALNLGDVESLRKGVKGFQPFIAAPVRVEELQLHVGDAILSVHLLGTDEHGLKVRGQRVARGRYLQPADSMDGEPATCVLEPEADHELARGSDLLGASIQVPGKSGPDVELRVVGVLAPRSPRTLATDDFGLETGHFLHRRVWKMLNAFGVVRPDDAWKRTDACVHVPLRLLPRKDDSVDWILVSGVPQEAPALADGLRGALLARGAQPVAYANLVWPVLASDRIEQYMLLKDALVLACLAMGGVVIANVMLLSLLERTGEIAVRRAEGATQGDILSQFLAEAGALGLAGAALGVPLGMGLAWVRIQFIPYSLFDFTFPARTVAWAVPVGIAAAVLAGILPARRAARLDPAEALREA